MTEWKRKKGFNSDQCREFSSSCLEVEENKLTLSGTIKLSPLSKFTLIKVIAQAQELHVLSYFKNLIGHHKTMPPINVIYNPPSMRSLLKLHSYSKGRCSPID